MALDTRNKRPDGSGAPPKTVKGIASNVALEPDRGRAVKTYHGHPLIGAIYRIAFQAPFPYIRNLAALQAAKYRRRIAGAVTQFFLGRNVVTPVVAIEKRNERVAFVTEFVTGSEPRDHHRARRFLHKVTDAFIRTGLPTWQVSPYNPRSLGNLIETPEGDYRIIDLESNVVTPMLPLTGFWAAARDAHLPPFDDIDMPRLWTWIEKNREEIERRLGSEGAKRLISDTAGYAWYQRLWQGNELRLWSRLLRLMARALDGPAHLRALAHRVSGWRDNAPRAAGWLCSGIARWEREGRITAEQAAAARRDLEQAQTLAVLTHLGAHLTMSIPLRFPLGALARLTWTAFFRLRAEMRALLRLQADSNTRSARATHSLLVMAAAAVPGFGSGAYIFASPMRRNRVLLAVAMDQGLRLLPFRLYERLRLRAVTHSLANSPDAGYGVSQVALRTLPRDLQRMVRDLKPYAGMVCLIAAAGVSVVIVAAAYVAATGSTESFHEIGPVSILKLAESLAIGVIGVEFYRRFWRRPDAEQRPGAAMSLFWPVAGLAIAWIAADDYFEIHETVTGLLSGLPVLEHAGQLVILGYFVFGLALVSLFEREIRSSDAVFLLSAIGLIFVVATFAFDALVAGEDTAIEETAHLMATTALLSAFAVGFRQMVSGDGIA